MNKKLNEVEEVADYGVFFDNVWDVYEQLIDILGPEDLLEQLAKAMGDDELTSNLRYIVRMNDLEDEITEGSYDTDDFEIDDDF